MKRALQTVLLSLAVAVVVCAVAPAHAQVPVSSTAVKAKPLHNEQGKPVKGKFQVMHMLPSFIQVRNLENATDVHNFTYADSLRPRMEQMLVTGGYQYGDKVTIVYWPDQQVAVKISGKPSKP